ncbi:MAG: hypothetical protein KKA79_05055 [Nanoarchaeota archaeon]|nr:hypothetical protein [Nanoarchaeota archaeon]MCG2718881.1 hypothetical protein [Nanoarchaeota archaeon]
MKFPNTFRPEKNLDNKTKQLYEEAKIFVIVKSQAKNKYVEEELEKILEDMRYKDYRKLNYVHERIDNIIEASDYRHLTQTVGSWTSTTKIRYEHFIRKDIVDPELYYIFTRRHGMRKSRTYSLIKTRDISSTAYDIKSNLKSLEKYLNIKSKLDYLYENDATCLSIPIILTAAVTGMSGPKFLMEYSQKNLNDTILLGAFGGVMVGALIGFLGYLTVNKTIKKNYRKRMRKLEPFCEEIIVDDKKSLEEAFKQ